MNFGFGSRWVPYESSQWGVEKLRMTQRLDTARNITDTLSVLEEKVHSLYILLLDWVLSEMNSSYWLDEEFPRRTIGFFLAPTGAQEMIIFIRPLVRPSLVCLKLSHFTFLVQTIFKSTQRVLSKHQKAL